MRKILVFLAALSLIVASVFLIMNANDESGGSASSGGNQQTSKTTEAQGSTSANPPDSSGESGATTLPQNPEDPSSPSGIPVVPTQPGDQQETMVAGSVHAITEQSKATDGTVVFKYTYQHLSLVLNNQDVADKVILDFLNRADRTRANAQSVANSASSAYKNQSNWIPYQYSLTYAPARIDSKVLSLSGINEIYDGGSHPSRSFVAASYDLITGDVLTLGSIMTAEAKADDFCNLVLEILANRTTGDLFPRYEEIVRKRFETDVNYDEDWHFSTTGLCFSFNPNQIAGYNSGVVTVEIPYERLQGLLYHAYFPANLLADGALKTMPFSPTAVTQFTHMAEMVMDPNGSMLILYAEGSVKNVQLVLEDKVVFAANCISEGDAVVLQASSATQSKLILTYQANGQTVTIPLGQ